MQPCEQKETIQKIHKDIEGLTRRLQTSETFWEKMYIVLQRKSKLEKLLLQKEVLIEKLRKELASK